MNFVRFSLISLMLIICIVTITLAIILFRTFAIGFSESAVIQSNCSCNLNVSNETIERFQSILRIETVSYDNDTDKNRKYSNFLRLHRHLVTSFPMVHNSSIVTVEVINSYSLLYTILGRNESLKPYMLAAHLDVVPANAKDWDFSPFGAHIDNGVIYGRGTIDDKQNVMGIMEAVEFLLTTGFVPERTFYLAFGHDEEIMGNEGAREIAKVLQFRKIQLEYILDEGLFITKGVINFVNVPVAMIGVAEKGFLTLKLSVKSDAGHSSAPPRSTAVGILAKAVSRLEENPHSNVFGSGVEVPMLESLAPYAPFLYKLILANLWLFSPVVALAMALDRVQNSFIRTTTAVTMFHGGIKSNVIPDSAFAIVNHRIHQAQTISEVIAYDKLIINDDRVQITIVDSSEPSPISPYDQHTLGYKLLKMTLHNVHPDVVVVPSVLVASTDCKSYLQFTSKIYRFSPIILEKVDLARFHGSNERISIGNFQKTIHFYYCLILNSNDYFDDPMSHTKQEL